MHDLLLLPLGLIVYPDVDPVIVRIGPLAIHWYGLAYVGGILLGWWYARRLVSTPQIWAGETPPMAREDLDDFLVWAAVGIIAGGRLGYVLFYDFAQFAANPLSVFAIWSGGMSFHGGLLGTVLAMILFARRRGIATWSLLDTIGAVVPIGLFLGRIANFVNAELWGRTTDVAWAMVFPTDPLQLPRHPSQLYEALLEGLVLFVVLRVLTHRSLMLRKPGFVAGAFVAGYGLSRIIVEFFREPDAHIGYLFGGWLTMGMVLSLPMVIAGIWAMARARSASAKAAQ